MSGTPVVDAAVEVISPMQKQTEIRKMNPVIAPIYTDITMAFGASRDAFLISSASTLSVICPKRKNPDPYSYEPEHHNSTCLLKNLVDRFKQVDWFPIPNELCNKPKIAAKPVLKPVKFWKSLKTKLAGCLWSFVARIVMMTITKERIFQIRMKREIRSRR